MRLPPLALAACLTAATPAASAAGRQTRIAPADVAIAEQLRDKALKDDVAWDFTEGLSTEFPMRMPGSDGDLESREWVIARFKQLGFDKVWSEPVSYPVWVRRGESAEIVSPFAQKLVVTALGNSPATPAGGLVGEIVAFPTLDALKAAEADSVRGKVVYVGARMVARQDGKDYGIGTTVRTHGPSIASQKGAIGFLLRSAGTDRDRLPHTGATRFADGVAPIPAAALSVPDAEQVERVLQRGQPVRVKLALDCGMDGVYTGANVVGELTGSKKPGEYFLMGGHLDAWDLGTGAIDDAVGIGISVGAAKLIAELPRRPARSIRVVAWANEENGIHGGNAYGERHRKDVARIVLGSESDLGADRIYKMSATVKPEARDALAQIAAVLQPLGIAYDAEFQGKGGADLAVLQKAGMAAVSMHRDATRYFGWHHTANDTLDKIDLEQLRQNVAGYAVLAYLAAQAEGDFGSKPGAFQPQDKRN